MCNAGGARPIKVRKCVMQAGLVRLRLGMSKARGRGRSATLNCTCA